jgi:uncharacterized protein DUF3309
VVNFLGVSAPPSPQRSRRRFFKGIHFSKNVLGILAPPPDRGNPAMAAASPGRSWFLAGEFGPIAMLARFPIATREVEQMYVGGGILGTVVIVLIVLFLVGRI